MGLKTRGQDALVTGVSLFGHVIGNRSLEDLVSAHIEWKRVSKVERVGRKGEAHP